MPLQSLLTTLASKSIRKETLHGRPYTVVPMVMLTEGVHHGSNGPIYYPADECAKTPVIWNSKPIVVYHPEMEGQPVSACDPAILEKQSVGIVLNTKWDNKLRSEAWLDETRIDVVDQRISDFLNKNKIMEVSTGLFTDNEQVEGEFNGEKYSAIARNFRPDHLALLPDKVGACSVADGAGLLQINEARMRPILNLGKLFEPDVLAALKAMGVTVNEMSHSNIWSALSRQLRENLGDRWDGWLEDVYDSFAIYSKDGKLFRVGYTSTDSSVSLKDENAEEVVRVTEYRTPAGAFVGNSTGSQTEELDMDKKKLVDGLIANTATEWTEADRESLMGLDEKVLQKMTPKAVEPAPANNGQQPPATQPATTVVPAVNGTTAPPSLEAWLTTVPVAFRGLVANSIQVAEARKQELITAITSNERNRFTKEFLGTLEVNQLEAMAELATPPQQQFAVNGVAPQPLYFGAGGGVPAYQQNAHKEEPLLAPTMNFAADDNK